MVVPEQSADKSEHSKEILLTDDVWLSVMSLFKNSPRQSWISLTGHFVDRQLTLIHLLFCYGQTFRVVNLHLAVLCQNVTRF